MLAFGAGGARHKLKGIEIGGATVAIGASTAIGATTYASAFGTEINAASPPLGAATAEIFGAAIFGIVFFMVAAFGTAAIGFGFASEDELLLLLPAATFATSFFKKASVMSARSFLLTAGGHVILADMQ